ncbi:MAG: hypothetical protein WCV90_06545 [Candidatus Woesearchaeota archaeon]
MERVILKTLNKNLGYKPGERVLIIQQNWSKGLSKETKSRFELSKKVCQKMFQVYKKVKVDVSLLTYFPKEARSGVDVPKGTYTSVLKDVPEIIFMPTAYSLSHVPSTKLLLKKGARIASMPSFTLDMFAENGPMSANPLDVGRRGEKIYQKYKKSNFIHITGKKTDIVVEVDPSIVHHAETGIIKKGDLANLPAGEVCGVPKHLGKSHGYITVPKGWGGPFPLKYEITLIAKNGRFVNILNDDPKAKEYINSKLKPLIFGKKGFDVLAELGIGTNHKITPQYIQKHGWSALTAEKIIGSAHFANGCSAGLGGKNDVPVHLDWVVPKVKIDFDYKIKNKKAKD